ncbi:MAG: hypothetical protein IPL46_10075 [Saprospiraceae bacterium]|nr:hypothetical protein [Saprospiraceae bacterium]
MTLIKFQHEMKLTKVQFNRSVVDYCRPHDSGFNQELFMLNPPGFFSYNHDLGNIIWMQQSANPEWVERD